MKRTAIFSPDWFNKSAIYQINPRTFSKEGTIQAITDEIPFLKDLGFRILYLCPVFEADKSLDNRSPRQLASKTNNPKNPYRMNDYFSIDNEYGTMDDLRVLVKKAHEAGMYVLLDLVYNLICKRIIFVFGGKRNGYNSVILKRYNIKRDGEQRNYNKYCPKSNLF